MTSSRLTLVVILSVRPEALAIFRAYESAKGFNPPSLEEVGCIIKRKLINKYSRAAKRVAHADCSEMRLCCNAEQATIGLTLRAGPKTVPFAVSCFVVSSFVCSSGA